MTNTSHCPVIIASWPANTIPAAAALFGQSIAARQIRKVDFPSPFLSPLSPFYSPVVTHPLYPQASRNAPGRSVSPLVKTSPPHAARSLTKPVLAADWLAGRLPIQSVHLLPLPFVPNVVKDSRSRQAAHIAGNSTSRPPTCYSTDKAPLSILVTR